MVFSIYGIDNQFAASTGANVNSFGSESDFDYPPNSTKDLVITTNPGDPDPRLFEIGDTYDISWGGNGGSTIEDAVVVRSDAAPGTGQPGIVVFEGTDAKGDPAQIIWTPDFDLEGWYWDNFNSGNPPRFYSTDTDPNYTHSYICFSAEARVTTMRGPVPAGAVCVGDRVLTRDHGYRPVVWVSRKTVAGRGAAAPVRFAPGTIGNDGPLRLSQQHRVLLASPRAELLFGAHEVLVPAKALVDGAGIAIAPCARVTYVHLLLDQHEILRVEDVPCESLFPGHMAIEVIEEGDPDAGLSVPMVKDIPTARPVLSLSEARVLLAAAPLRQPEAVDEAPAQAAAI